MKNYHKAFLNIVIAIVLLVGTATITYATSKINPTPEKPITLKMATFFQKTDIRQEFTEKWGEAITNVTNGAIKFRYFPGQSLVRAKEMADALKSGLIDATTFFVTAYTPEDFPFASSVFMIPFCIPDNFDKEMLLQEKSKDVMYQSFAKHNIQPIWGMFTGYGQEWFFKNPINPKDIKSSFEGKRLRSPGGFATLQAIKWLGAERVGMSSTEVYEAGQKGIIQGCTLGFAQYVSTHTYEVFPYMLSANNSFTFPGGVPCVIRLDLWNSLPKEMQNKIMEVSKPLEKEFYIAYGKQVDTLRNQLVKEGKIKQVVLLDAATKKKWDTEITKMVDKILTEKFPKRWPVMGKAIAELQGK